MPAYRWIAGRFYANLCGKPRLPMYPPMLFRRRTVLLPTLPGLLLMLALVGLLLVFGGRQLPGFLAVDEPQGSGYLVIEGWIGKAGFAQAYRVFQQHDYRLALVSGGPITDDFNEGPSTYAQRGRDYLLSLGFPADRLVAVEAPYVARDRSFRSALAVRDWLSAQGLQAPALDVFTTHIHARRSRFLYRLAFGDALQIGSHASVETEYDLERWWRSSRAAKSVLMEWFAWVYVKCCFFPPSSPAQT